MSTVDTGAGWGQGEDGGDMSEDPVAWLIEQIAEDERHVRGPGRPSILGLPRKWVNRVWFPSRIRDECAAKRRIIELHQMAIGDSPGHQVCGSCQSAEGRGLYEDYPCPTIRILALPFFDREGYREEWTP